MTTRAEARHGTNRGKERIKVLFLCYHFPPMGGAGVQRSIGFIRHLPAFGFQPIVVAGPSKVEGRWEPEDPDLTAKLPADLEIHRPDSTPPSQTPAAVQVSRRLGRPPPRFRWWRRVLLETATRVAALHRPQLIYVTLLPLESLAPALVLGRRLDIPVVVDLRDSWELDETRVYPTGLHRWFNRTSMHRQLRQADLVIMNTREAREVARETFPDIPSQRIQYITNGYDPDDFDFEDRPPLETDGRFHILHTGSLHTGRGMEHRSRGTLKRALTSELWPVDFLGRSPFYLLQALELIQKEHPSRAACIDLQLFGGLTDADRDLLDRSSMASQVQRLGFRSHTETVAAQMTADLLFLPMHGLPAGCRSRVVPLKTYEYLASGRPILAAVPEGDARDFVHAADAGCIVAPDDPRALADAILEFMADAPAPGRPLTPEVTRFGAGVRTEELARHFFTLLRDGNRRPQARPEALKARGADSAQPPP